MPVASRTGYPASLRGADTGTFAHLTVTERMPRTLRRVIADTDWPEETVGRLEALLERLPHGPLPPIEDSGPDAAEWARHLAPHDGESWLEVPWFLAETYFFRRLLAETGYFDRGPGRGVDPFAPQKAEALRSARDDLSALAPQLAAWNEAGWSRGTFRELLYLALWGNQADLNLFPDGAGAPDHRRDAETARAHLLVDDAAEVAAYVDDAREGGLHLDLVVDNAGFEFLADLALADYVLATGVAAEVVLHVKAHPTFVSDVTLPDVQATMDFLARDGTPAVRALAARLRAAFVTGRLGWTTHPFWTSPLPGWKMPRDLKRVLRASDLVVVKGDAGYRRLVGDLDWPHETPFDEIVDYLPAPLVALRTLKAEVAAGLPPGRSEQLDQEDPDWLVDGRWGVVQFVP